MANRLAGAFLATFMFAQVPCILAQEVDAQGLPHAFPREGAIQVFDNSWGTAWNATWTPHKPTSLHQHTYDFVGVELVDTSFSLSAPGQQPRTVFSKRGASYFLPKGTTHVEEGLSSNPPRHAVLIDLKDTPSRSYNNSTSYPMAFPMRDAIKVVENQRIIMWDYTWTPGQSTPIYFHDRDSFVMIVDGGELTLSTSDAAPQVISVSPGQVLFNPGGRAYAEHANKGAVRAIIVELK